MIRTATFHDVKSIAKVHVDSWRTTYKNIVTKEFLASLSYEKREQLWERVLTNGNGGVFVAENSQGEVIGFASGGKERTEKYDQYKGEVYAIYILQQYQKKGIGKELLKAVAHYLTSKQLNSMLVWVVEDNKSCLFYEALGGKKIETMEVEIGGRKLNEVAYGWADLSEF
jgi:L-amino acid N-acyltransferase YncA